MLIRLMLADSLKMKGSSYYPIIFGVPFFITFLFLAWCILMPCKPYDILHYYILVLCILLPASIGAVTSIPFNIEQKCGNYKEMLSTGYGRKTLLISKILLIILSDLCSLIISVFIFYILFQCILGHHLLNASNYLYLVFIIFICHVIIIIFHVWISLTIGKGGSIGIGICETFINAILMTGIGNGIWQWFPCSWSVMLSHAFLACSKGIYLPLSEGIGLINNELFYFIIITAIFFYLLLLWFSKYEGKYYHN
jgi:ABC-2 type transport system permease protein